MRSKTDESVYNPVELSFQEFMAALSLIESNLSDWRSSKQTHAFRKKIKLKQLKYHPDKNTDEGAKEKFLLISEFNELYVIGDKLEPVEEHEEVQTVAKSQPHRDRQDNSHTIFSFFHRRFCQRMPTDYVSDENHADLIDRRFKANSESILNAIITHIAYKEWRDISFFYLDSVNTMHYPSRDHKERFMNQIVDSFQNNQQDLYDLSKKLIADNKFGECTFRLIKKLSDLDETRKKISDILYSLEKSVDIERNPNMKLHLGDIFNERLQKTIHAFECIYSALQINHGYVFQASTALAVTANYVLTFIGKSDYAPSLDTLKQPYFAEAGKSRQDIYQEITAFIYDRDGSDPVEKKAAVLSLGFVDGYISTDLLFTMLYVDRCPIENYLGIKPNSRINSLSDDGGFSLVNAYISYHALDAASPHAQFHKSGDADARSALFPELYYGIYRGHQVLLSYRHSYPEYSLPAKIQHALKSIIEIQDEPMYSPHI